MSNQNTTDYTFPPWWGLLQRRVDDDDDPLTKAEADERRSEWFTRQRTVKQVADQHDAGMWNQFDDDNGVPFEDAYVQATKNNYRLR